jgi:hypothetical protein
MFINSLQVGLCGISELMLPARKIGNQKNVKTLSGLKSPMFLNLSKKITSRNFACTLKKRAGAMACIHGPYAGLKPMQGASKWQENVKCHPELGSNAICSEARHF